MPERGMHAVNGIGSQRGESSGGDRGRPNLGQARRRSRRSRRIHISYRVVYYGRNNRSYRRAFSYHDSQPRRRGRGAFDRSGLDHAGYQHAPASDRSGSRSSQHGQLDSRPATTDQEEHSGPHTSEEPHDVGQPSQAEENGDSIDADEPIAELYQSALATYRRAFDLLRGTENFAQEDDLGTYRRAFDLWCETDFAQEDDLGTHRHAFDLWRETETLARENNRGTHSGAEPHDAGQSQTEDGHNTAADQRVREMYDSALDAFRRATDLYRGTFRP
ncbi:hypothetical protein MMC07_002318 [Pseudocyphellaria aurata]|nr:hypothetical protein [Pseudocyphellaria aurata]